MIAYCWRTGQIGFGDRLPNGCLPIADNVNAEVRDRIKVNARHAYDGVNYLVPGIPEAKGSDEALNALHRFRERIGAE